MLQDIIAIVPAAGVGRRFGVEKNKQFEMLCGKPLMIWALETLESMAEVKEIIPVIKENDMPIAERLFSNYNITKIRKIALGGNERQDSVFNGLRLIKNRESIVMIHDAARPLIDPDTIKNALADLPGSDGVVLAVPPKDTIKRASDGYVIETLVREHLYSVQTPQIFFYRPLFGAYENAMKELFYSTDDSALVEKNGGKIKIVQGSYMNIKVTTPEDMAIAEIFLRIKGIL